MTANDNYHNILRYINLTTEDSLLPGVLPAVFLTLLLLAVAALQVTYPELPLRTGLLASPLLHLNLPRPEDSRDQVEDGAMPCREQQRFLASQGSSPVLL